MNAVVYARYSSSSQKEESIGQQVAECKQYANSNGLTVVGIYSDKAISGRSDERPQFLKMINDSKHQLFNTVICYKTDRFSRNRNNAAIYRTKLKKNGVNIKYAKEHIPDGPEGIILESLLDGLAEYYSANLSQNILRGLADNASKCKVNGAVPMGYVAGEDGYYKIDEHYSKIVVEVFTRFAKGDNIKEIYTDLNRRGYRTRKGNLFNRNSFSKVLSNERYTGVYMYRDQRVEGGIPTIISKELYALAQKQFTPRTRPREQVDGKVYLLTGKLFCSHCGSLMVGDGGTSRTGKTHRYYTCKSKKQARNCNKKTVRKGWLENLIFRITKDFLNQPDIVTELSRSLYRHQQSEAPNVGLSILEGELKKTKKTLANVLSAIEQGVINKTTAKRMAELEEIQSELESQFAIEKIAHAPMSVDTLAFLIQDAAKEDDVRLFIGSYINSVYLSDTDIRIVFNYHPDPNQPSLKEITKLIEEYEGGNSSDNAPSPPPIKADN